jgi:hypothetical protein
LFKSLLVVRRHRRDAAIASNVFFFFVAMDEESWRHDTHGRITLQEIHGVEVGFPVDSQFRQPRLTCQVTRMHSCD